MYRSAIAPLHLASAACQAALDNSPLHIGVTYAPEIPPSTRNVEAVMKDGVVTSQERHRCSNLLRLAKTPDRDMYHPPCCSFRVLSRKALVEVGY